MFRGRILSYLLVVFLLILVSCSPGNRIQDQNISSYQMSRVNPGNFMKNDISYLSEVAKIETLIDSSTSFLTGDVTGSNEQEIILINKNNISVYDLKGNLIKEAEFEGMNFGEGILADIDSDSKMDILIGAAEEKGVRILGYSGVLEPLFDFMHSKLYNAKTKLHFYHDDHVYFTASSSLAIPPKIVGAFNVETEDLSWEYFTGPVPDDMAADKSFSNLTISNTAKSSLGLVLDDRNVSDHSKHHSGIYVLGRSGDVSMYKSIGPEFRVGEFTKNGISSITERFFDIDEDGEEELIVGINRVSEFFMGNSVIEVRSLDGTVEKRKEFLPETDLEFSFYNSNNGAEIALLLKQKGLFYILDNELNVTREWFYPGIAGVATLHESGDFNGDGKMEHLISVENYLFILNYKLDIIYSTALDSPIKKASFLEDNSKDPVLAILSDLLYLYGLSEDRTGSVSIFTNPPGAQILMNDTILDEKLVSGVLGNIETGTVTFQAEISGKKSGKISVKIKPGQHEVIRLEIENYIEEKESPGNQSFRIGLFPDPEIALSSWDNLLLKDEYTKKKEESLLYNGYDDFAGDASKDFLFFNNDEQRYTVYDNFMKILTTFKLPTDSNVVNVSGAGIDVDNNLKSELLLFNKSISEYSLYDVNGDLLRNKILGRFPDSQLSRPINDKNHFFIQSGSGYAQQPRGVLGVDLNASTISFFYRTASQPAGLVLTDNNVLLTSIHTLSNGGTVSYADEETAHDGEYFIHLADIDGNHLEHSFNPQFEENNGVLQFYIADFDHDGKSETYMVTNKSDYYTGTSKVFELNTENGSLSDPLFAAGENTSLSFHSELKKDGEALIAMRLRKPGEIYFLNSRFEKVGGFSMSDLGISAYYNLLFSDFDKDGTSELIAWNGEGFTVFDFDLNPIYKIERDFESDPLKRAIIEDMDLDGKYEIILITDFSVSIYGY